MSVDGVNAPIKRYRVADWVKKTRPIYLYAAYKRLTSELT